MRVRYQADADFNEDSLTGVLRREPTVDFKTAQAAGLAGLDDRTVLQAAAKEGRILVTHDRKTMPLRFADFVRTTASPGLLIVSQKLDILACIEDLILICTASEAEEWTNVDDKILQVHSVPPPKLMSCNLLRLTLPGSITVTLP